MIDQSPKRLGWLEFWAVIQLACAVFLWIALWSYSPSDSGFSRSDGLATINYAGAAGAWAADILYFFIGYASWIVPLMLSFLALPIIFSLNSSVTPYWRFLAWCLLIGAVIAQLAWYDGGGSSCIRSANLSCGSGGWLGLWLLPPVLNIFGALGTQLLIWMVIIVSISLATGFSWLSCADVIGLAVWRLGGTLSGLVYKINPSKNHSSYSYQDREQTAVFQDKREPSIDRANTPSADVSAPLAQPHIAAESDEAGTIPLPDINLLMDSEPSNDRDSETIGLQAHLAALLTEYNVPAQVVSACRGPVITRFEVQPSAGVKASRISALATDVARSMCVASVRVVEVSSGKSTVGVEVPNKRRSAIGLRTLLDSDAWRTAHSSLSLALGVNIEGVPVVVGLDDMPHMLVAGTTGSGKSVNINAMLLSILYKASPQEVRLLLIDPKMLELSVYEGIPHLLTPVITDMKEATAALRWCVVEMERRYRLLATLGVRDIKGYNDQILAAKSGEVSLDLAFENNTDSTNEQTVTTPEPLPLIVVVIDEFADMMMVTAKRAEELIVRLAQKARASGIHLVLATQRPSVDVITGLIKANIPSRIAFQVSASVDSRTVLDQNGAEKLLGNGDMLYMRPGNQGLERLHGAMVHDEEVHRVVAHYKSVAEPCYIANVLNPDERSVNVAMGSHGKEYGQALLEDELYGQALEVIMESGRASASYVQRRLRIGYNRAARLLDMMEASGVVSAMDSKGSRAILANRDKTTSIV